MNGYINLGDCIVLLSGWLLSPVFGFFAGGLGSTLADLFSGYAAYAPATFLIKGLMALIACGGVKLFQKRVDKQFSRIISGVTAELFMIAGYWLFEGFLYGFISSAVNIPANGLQGLAGLILGIILIHIFEKHKIMTMEQ